MAALPIAFSGPFNSAKNKPEPAALDTRNVFLNVVGQDRIEQQWIFGRKQECSWETNLPYSKRMHVVWTRSMFSSAFIRSPAEWQGDEKLV